MVSVTVNTGNPEILSAWLLRPRTSSSTSLLENKNHLVYTVMCYSCLSGRAAAGAREGRDAPDAALRSDSEP